MRAVGIPVQVIPAAELPRRRERQFARQFEIITAYVVGSLGPGQSLAVGAEANAIGKYARGGDVADELQLQCWVWSTRLAAALDPINAKASDVKGDGQVEVIRT